MESATAISSINGIIIPILIIMGYAIVFSYLFIADAKRRVKYLKSENDRTIKYLEERVERNFKRLQDENIELRRELRRLEARG